MNFISVKLLRERERERKLSKVLVSGNSYQPINWYIQGLIAFDFVKTARLSGLPENPRCWEPLSVVGKVGMLVLLKVRKSDAKLQPSLLEHG